jgi:hypothetical protein
MSPVSCKHFSNNTTRYVCVCVCVLLEITRANFVFVFHFRNSVKSTRRKDFTSLLRIVMDSIIIFLGLKLLYFITDSPHFLN